MRIIVATWTVSTTWLSSTGQTYELLGLVRNLTTTLNTYVTPGDRLATWYA